MGISRACASKWVNRWRRHGELGLLDRSSVPHHSPTANPATIVAQIETWRREEKWSAQRIAHELADQGIRANRRTVTRQLGHLGLNHRRFLDPKGDSNRQPGKITARWPGHMAHLDVKKVGRIRDCTIILQSLTAFIRLLPQGQALPDGVPRCTEWQPWCGQVRQPNPRRRCRERPAPAHRSPVAASQQVLSTPTRHPGYHWGLCGVNRSPVWVGPERTVGDPLRTSSSEDPPERKACAESAASSTRSEERVCDVRCLSQP